MADGRRVDVFFYGTFMAGHILADFGVDASSVLPVRVADYELTINPRVNLVQRSGSAAFGSLAAVTTVDIDRLYGRLLEDYEIAYQPVAVVTIDGSGHTRPAQCFLAAAMAPGPADDAYVRELAECVRSLGHPEQYAQHIESFLSAN